MTFRVVFLLQILLIHTVTSTCPDGAIEGFDEHDTAACYLYERFPAQFVTAERLCRDSHGHLASIGDLFVNDFVAQGGVEAFQVMEVDNFWIGGDDLEKRGDWEWISGANFDFTNWGPKEPVNDLRSFCIALSLPEGLWEAKSCYESKPYVCEVPASNSTTTITNNQNSRRSKTTPLRSTRHSPNVTQPSTICNNGWSYLNSTDLCYKVVDDASDCYRPNTQEASIHNKDENNFVGKLASKEAKNKENIKVRLSLAQYNPSKKDKLVVDGGTQVKPWLIPPHTWGVSDPARRRQYFNNLRKNKHHKKHDSSEEKHGDGWTWFDGSSVDYHNWAKNEPKKFDEFTCAQLETKNQKYSWSSTNCIKVEHAVCSQTPNRH